MAEDPKAQKPKAGAGTIRSLNPPTEGETAVAPPPVLPVKNPFKIMSAKGLTRWLKMIIYGEYGVGKTLLAASAQDVREMRDVIFIDVESGSRTIEDREDIDVIRVESFNVFARVKEFLKLHTKFRDEGNIEKLRTLEARLKEVPEEAISTPKQYRTVVVDSLTEVQKYCMYQLLGISVGDWQLDMEPENPQYAEWGKSTEMIRLLVRSFRDLPMNVIFVCAQQEGEDEKKRRHLAPALPGKLSLEVQGFVDVVGLLAANQPTRESPVMRRLYIAPGPQYKAKNRFRNFEGTYIDEPTMAQIWNANKGGS